MARTLTPPAAVDPLTAVAMKYWYMKEPPDITPNLMPAADYFPGDPGDGHFVAVRVSAEPPAYGQSQTTQPYAGIVWATVRGNVERANVLQSVVAASLAGPAAHFR